MSKASARLCATLFRIFKLIEKLIMEPPSPLYGSYIHNLLHSPQQLMLISMQSCNTEQLERIQNQVLLYRIFWKRVCKLSTLQEESDVPNYIY